MADDEPTPTMRIQLQRDDDEDDLDSRVLVPVPKEKEAWVTVKQVVDALEALTQSSKLPKSQQANARAARDKAIAWVTARPPDGVTTEGRRKGQSFGFERDRPYNGFRFDVENLRGHNLRS